MGWKCIKISRRNLTVTVTLMRPEVLNALDEEMIKEVEAALQVVTALGSVRAVILTGDGDRAFSVGADVRDLTEMAPEDFDAWMQLNQAFFDKIASLPMPVLAALNGYTLGGGLELALACDIRIAKEGAKLGFPEAQLGVIPGTGGTQRLTRLLGPGLAKELILSGRQITAEEALRMGLVTQVIPADQWAEGLESYVQTLISRAPMAQARAKRCIDLAGEMTLEEGLTLERKLNLECFTSDDFREGVAAFKEKRPPSFRGR